MLTRLPEGDELVEVSRRGERDSVELLGGDSSDPSQLEVRRRSASERSDGHSKKLTLWTIPTRSSRVEVRMLMGKLSLAR